MGKKFGREEAIFVYFAMSHMRRSARDIALHKLYSIFRVQQAPNRVELHNQHYRKCS